MKINPLDAHDRLQHFKKTDFNISECCQDLINQAPFGNRPFYIFAHSRTEDDSMDKRVIWQPRLTKPKAQTNSMLFKGRPGTDIIRIIWMIPAVELWAQYRKGLLMQDKTICDSIADFNHNRKKLEMSEDEDPTDEEVNLIYQEISQQAKHKKAMNKLWNK
jgi:hypothetical protein